MRTVYPNDEDYLTSEAQYCFRHYLYLYDQKSVPDHPVEEDIYCPTRMINRLAQIAMSPENRWHEHGTLDIVFGLYLVARWVVAGNHRHASRDTISVLVDRAANWMESWGPRRGFTRKALRTVDVYRQEIWSLINRGFLKQLLPVDF